MPDGNISKAAEGLRAPSQGSIGQDASSFLARFLQGAREEQIRQEELALERAKIGVNKEFAAAQQTSAKAQVEQVEVARERNELERTREQRLSERNAREMDLLDQQIATLERDLGEAESQSGPNRELLLRVRPEGLTDAEIHNMSPRQLQDWAEHVQRMAEIGAQSDAALAPVVMGAFEQLGELRENLATVSTAATQYEAALARRQAEVAESTVLVNRTGPDGEPEQVPFVLLSPEEQSAVLNQDPDIQRIREAINLSQQNAEFIQQEYQRQAQWTSLMLNMALDGMSTEMRQSVEQSAPAVELGLVEPPEAAQTGDLPRRSVDTTPAPDSVVTDARNLAAQSPDTLARVLPGIRARFPTIDQQLASAGVNTEALQEAFEQQTQQAFEQASRAALSAPLGPWPPTEDQTARNWEELLTAMDPSLAPDQRGVPGVNQATRLLASSRRLSAAGVQLEEVERAVAERYGSGILESALWENVEDRWPKRLGSN